MSVKEDHIHDKLVTRRWKVDTKADGGERSIGMTTGVNYPCLKAEAF